ncbi:MAG: M48 family metallopeptidase [Cellulomonadaceae bacterium]|nr:M48 family metallopeptidase [Cellulomonadaceae bacterium]
MVVAIPARFTRTQEREWVRRMVTKLAVQDQRRRPSDAQLAARAAELSTRYLDGRARPLSIAWSGQQGRRWGSCTPTEGTIRISTRLQGMPRWVQDYVVLHELTHLLHGGHGPEFWALVERYPRTDRARGFLEGYAFSADGAAGEAADEHERHDEPDLHDEPDTHDETDPPDAHEPPDDVHHQGELVLEVDDAADLAEVTPDDGARPAR